MRSVRARGVLAGLVVLLAAGCAGGDAAETESVVATPPTEPAGGQASAGREPAPEPTPGSVEALPPNRDIELPPRVEVAEEVRHSSGTIVRLESIGFTQSAVEVEVTITNGNDTAQELANTPYGGAVLADDGGNEYPFLAPDDNMLLRVESGEQLEGQLVFAGRLPPDARSLTLVFNPDASGENIEAVYPRVVFADIAVRGVVGDG